MIIRTVIPFGILVIVFWLIPDASYTQNPPRAAPGSTRDSAKTPAFDAKKSIEALVNKNPAPTVIHDGESPAKFASNYDFDEQVRIPKVILNLFDHAETAWPDLVRSLGDERYSVTFQIHDRPTNWTVGDVCEEIICDYLVQGYFFHEVPELTGETERVVAVRRPMTTEDLKKWCEKEKGKKLYELQVDMCQREIDKIPELFPEATKSEQKKSIDGIRAEIRSLHSTKKAIRPEAFYLHKGAMGEGGGAYGDDFPRTIR